MHTEYVIPCCDHNTEHEVCTEEGLYYCRLCQKAYCFDHMCSHIEWSAQNDINPKVINSIQFNEDDENFIDESIKMDVRPNSKISLASIQNLSESQLRAELRNIFIRAKLIQRELERRMIECSGFSYTYEVNRGLPRAQQSKTTKRLSKELRLKRALQQLLDLGQSTEQILRSLK